MKKALRNVARSTALGLALVLSFAGPAFAQTTTDNRGGTSGTTTTNNTGTTATTGTHTDRGSNWGWLGLVGLIGLAGLIRGSSDRTDVRTDTRRDTGVGGTSTTR